MINLHSFTTGTVRFFVVVVSCGVVLSSTSLYGALVYSESFPENTSSFPGTVPDYAEWTNEMGPADWAVVNGELRTSNGVHYTTNILSVAIPSLSLGTVSATIRPIITDVSWTSPGILVGDVAFRFHPGHTGGAFMVTGDSTRYSMGFTPATNSTYEMDVSFVRLATTTDFSISISDGTHTFATARTFDNSVVGAIDRVGFVHVNGGTVVFDDFRVEGVVPEPTSAVAWLCLTGIGLSVIRLRKRQLASVTC